MSDDKFRHDEKPQKDRDDRETEGSRDQEPVDKRPNVGTTQPEDYPDPARGQT
jgi:hypothetical protein